MNKKMQCKLKAFRFNRTACDLNLATRVAYVNKFPSTRLHKFSPFRLLAAAAARLNLLEEIITLVINEDECWEILNLNLPDSFHTKFRVLNALDALDVVLRKDGCRATD